MPSGKSSLKPQHAPKAPHEDPRFLESTPARPLRILAEYLHPLVQLKREGIADTIVMFGSARIESHETAQARWTRLKKTPVKKLSEAARAKHRSEVRRARHVLEMSRYYEEARQLSHKITSWALTLGPRPRRFVVCSGGGPGIMEAANRGAHEAGGKSIGLSIELPHEQFANSYISPELSFNFHYFFMRKLWFAQIAKALIVFPGGFGTMDELWEMLTLLQTGKLPKHNIILIYGRKYWDEVLDWKVMVNSGTINEEEYKLLQFADSVDEAFDYIRSGLEKYHMDVDPFLQAY
ncbi:MAG TPA: TIGR00730 family Rossman fold protein [Candidatus Acidoferrum sp.]|nr:TIGR00730 family Rossman fold protein [Candidatus Acidoferrum sp.]